MLIAYAVLVLVTVAGFAYQRQPDDLSQRVPSFSVSLLRHKWAFLSLNLIFLTIYCAIPKSAFTLFKAAFSLSRIGVEKGLWFQFFTHSLVHANISHLLGNMMTMVLLSAYWQELRARNVFYLFFAGSFISGLASMIFIDGLFMGASGGIAAIGGALLVKWREIKNSRTLFVALACVAVIYVMANLSNKEDTKTSVDHLGHIAGFVFGLTFGYQRKVFGKSSQNRADEGLPKSV